MSLLPYNRKEKDLTITFFIDEFVIDKLDPIYPYVSSIEKIFAREWEYKEDFHSHDIPELVFMYKGSARVYIPGRAVLELKESDWCQISAKESHKISLNRGGTLYKLLFNSKKRKTNTS